jgi:membrane protein DedA with SNARE-associated domain
VHLDVVAVALAGAAGILVRSCVACGLGRLGGRPLIERFWRYVLLRPHDLDRAERFYARHGTPAVLLARVLPVVRTLISMPAGMAEMPFATFSLLTLLGGLTWAFALALAGDALAANWQRVSSTFTAASTVLAVLVVARISLLVFSRFRAPRRLGVPPDAAASSRMTTPRPVAGSYELFDRR